MQLEIISPTKSVCDLSDVESVTFPTLEGIVTVLPFHEDILGVVTIGEVVVKKKDNKTEKYYIDRGVYRIQDNKLLIMSDNAEPDDKSILDQIKQATDKSQQTIASDKSLSYETLVKLEKQLRFQRFMEEKLTRN